LTDEKIRSNFQTVVHIQEKEIMAPHEAAQNVMWFVFFIFVVIGIAIYMGKGE
jgi:hypothetical protein